MEIGMKCMTLKKREHVNFERRSLYRRTHFLLPWSKGIEQASFFKYLRFCNGEFEMLEMELYVSTLRGERVVSEILSIQDGVWNTLAVLYTSKRSC